MATALINGQLVKLVNPSPGIYYLPNEDKPKVRFKYILEAAFFTNSKIAPQGIRQMDWGKAKRLIRLGKWKLPLSVLKRMRQIVANIG